MQKTIFLQNVLSYHGLMRDLTELGVCEVCTKQKNLSFLLPLPASPGPVGNITLNSPSVDQLTVAWAPPTTGGVPTSYNVSINDSVGTYMVIPDNGSPTYTHTFTVILNLTSNTVYNITVIVVNCAGTNGVSKICKRSNFSN